MEFVTTNDSDDEIPVGRIESVDLSFLPASLAAQCRSLIESYHELHGYSCLPDVLWKSRLGHFIETHREFRELLRKASTTRSAKKSNESFVLIATAILSLEILASKFAGWSAIYPEARSMAHAILQGHARSPHMPLMEFYLYPPKYVSSAAIAALMPPRNRPSSEAKSCSVPSPEVAGNKQVADSIPAVHRPSYGGASRVTAALPT